eukprot:TRINITY_DN603_c0_g3_i4.p4 TRINITY_DN603_c0_g3~~TRINITY_DN603_c0_g3_i4.p4  ORF type:complete len:130 (-),score=46.80 TRINITY_DN603_c0_g3_i4:286-675(-)
MESRFCKLHRNKPLEHFCWTCQCLICIFCVQEHESYKHRTNSLLKSSCRKSKKDGKKVDSKVPMPPSQEQPQAPAKEKPVAEKPKPPAKEAAGEPCIRCEKPVQPKEVQLKCHHWVHTSCLREYVSRTS